MSAGQATTGSGGDLSSGLPVPKGLERGAHGTRDDWVASGRFAVELLARTVGRSDLGDVSVLDVGCGTKVTKTLLDLGAPIGRYVGVDVSADVIGWLQANVTDPRFDYYHLAARNDLYNPTGTPLGQFDELPVAGARFDLLSLFSVFTHLDPEDYVSMLHLLRKHVKPDGRLLYSLHLRDQERLSSFEVALRKRLQSSDPAEVAAAEDAIAEALAKDAGSTSTEASADERFVDEVPDRPLLIARYTEEYALELLQGTGWEVEALHPPVHSGTTTFIQHHLVCRPI